MLLLPLCLGAVSLAQTTVKNYYPVEMRKVDLSAETEKEINRQNELLSQKKLNEEERRELDVLLTRYGEVVESVWDVINGGCSWYCGGGNYKVTASSYLPQQNTVSYNSESANDLNYKTAWVEGKNGSGIGEFLKYFFRNGSQRFSRIIVSNGYMKSQEAWQNNNRVKKLRFSVNGKEWGIFNLEDSRTDQVFEVGEIGHSQNGSDLVLQFEILEVYRGKKFNDTAITEIYFDGDHHH